MRALTALVALALLLTETRAGDYCDNFEPSGDFGSFWYQVSQDSNGKWEPTSYNEIKQAIPNFPAPDSGDVVMYLALPEKEKTASARMETVKAYRFPKGSSITFRYWLRSTYTGASTLYACLADGMLEQEKIVDLHNHSSPDNTDWAQVTAPIVADENKHYQIMIVAVHYVNNITVDNIAIDDIVISGPDDLPDRECEPVTTTTAETTTTEPTTTTAEPTTATTETTTSTTEESTTTEPPTTTTEPPSTTTEPPTTTTEPPTTTTEATTSISTTSETTQLPPTSTAGPGRGDDRQYGSSAFLWVVFVVLGSSTVLALVLALTRRRRRRDDRLVPDSSSTSTSSGSSGWYQYVTDDYWTRLQGRLRRLWQ